MKKISFLLLSLSITIGAIACPVCEKQQPKVLRGIAHGAGPESEWDYAIVTTGVLIVVLTVFFSLKWLFRPGERSENHIKQTVIDL